MISFRWIAAVLFSASVAAAQTAVIIRGDAPYILADAATLTTSTDWGPITAQNYGAAIAMVDCTSLTAGKSFTVVIKVRDAVDGTLLKWGEAEAVSSCINALLYLGGGVVPDTDSAGSQFSGHAHGSLPRRFYLGLELPAATTLEADFIIYPIPN